MTEEADDSGRIRAYKNQAHEPGSKLPAFKGSITLEGSSEQRQVALWARKSKKTDKTYFIGKVGETAAEQIERIAANTPTADDDSSDADQPSDGEFTLKPHQVKLFPNARKQEGTKQPDYFGYYNPGEGKKQQRLDVWTRNDKFGKPMLSGSVTEALTKQELEQKQEQQKQEQQNQNKKPAKTRKRAMSV